MYCTNTPCAAYPVLCPVFKVCPGLKHLNIGQVPKVNAHSLRVMASQLKCLVSLNLTALQAVSVRSFQKKIYMNEIFYD